MGITASKSTLSEGDILQLNCTLGAQRSSSRYFQVAWFLDGVEVARLGPCGLLAWKKEYEERAGLGQLRAFKQSSSVYVLTVYGVGPKDSGAYHCSASEVKAPGDVQSILTNLSSAVTVNVKPIGQSVLVALLGKTCSDPWAGECSESGLTLAGTMQLLLTARVWMCQFSVGDNGKSICPGKCQCDRCSSCQQKVYVFSLVSLRSDVG